MQSRLLYVALLSVFVAPALCAVPPESKYSDVSLDAPHATIHGTRFGAPSTVKCQMPGSHDGCTAWLLLVDGKVVAAHSINTRVEPGVRHLSFMCMYSKGGPAFFGTPGTGLSSIIVRLDARGDYRAMAQRTADSCSVTLIDSETGKPVVEEVPAAPPDAQPAKANN